MSATGHTPGPPGDAAEAQAAASRVTVNTADLPAEAEVLPAAAAVLPAAVAIAALARGPRGALMLSGIAVALLFIGWLLFYFFLFIPRGAIG